MRAAGAIAALLLGPLAIPRASWAPPTSTQVIVCRDGDAKAWVYSSSYPYHLPPPKRQRLAGCDVDNKCDGVCTACITAGEALCVPGTTAGGQEYVSHVAVGMKRVPLPPFPGLNDFILTCKRGRRARCRQLRTQP